MIERTESEAAGFVCPFSRNAAQVERYGANNCIGSRCMLWVTGDHAVDVFDVSMKDIQPHIPETDPFSYITAAEKRYDEVHRLRTAIEAWAKATHNREVISASNGSLGVRVTLKGESTGHCGVVR